jgi:hypothetical protein
MSQWPFTLTFYHEMTKKFFASKIDLHSGNRFSWVGATDPEGR